ncbi:NUDIX hydrolase [Tepidicaulis marinus]|uniref:NUDIX hydrolase n=1 Tax=Tepidicaulis marinus TaxID=1333998 RepID=A0A081B8P1_9HYPH|nr:CoA pyrophosphatase [Tepidicaulis marinus]GAK44409.1 NUDIX hydrolase [Tepidicaulis marinus]
MTEFNDTLKNRLATGLGAFQHQLADAPHLKHAAVCLTLLSHPEQTDRASLLLTRRAPRLSSHAGQWALPGGRIDKGESPLEAARRELREEVNLNLEDTHCLGRLDDYETRSGYLISPFVFWAQETGTMRPNPGEVASLHPIALEAFDRPDSPEFINIPESERPVIRLYFEDSNIHAPTAAVLYQFLELALHGRVTRVAHYEQPVWAWK